MRFDRYGCVIPDTSAATAKAAADEAWWREWRAARRRQHYRDPDDMTPAWNDPNAASTPSTDHDHRRNTHETFEDETGR